MIPINVVRDISCINACMDCVIISVHFILITPWFYYNISTMGYEDWRDWRSMYHISSKLSVDDEGWFNVHTSNNSKKCLNEGVRSRLLVWNQGIHKLNFLLYCLCWRFLVTLQVLLWCNSYWVNRASKIAMNCSQGDLVEGPSQVTNTYRCIEWFKFQFMG